jgi:molybdate transport system permease protein
MIDAKRRTSVRRTPVALLVLAGLGVALFLLPIVGLIGRTPWSDLPSLLTSDIVVDAIRLSLVVSVGATAMSALFGLPLAYVLARAEFKGRSVVRSLVLLPLVLPPVVGGAALLFALGRRGVIGEPLYSLTGLVLPFSTWGVLVAVTFVSMPFLVITVEGALRNMDQRYEHAAASLGAGNWTVLRRVTLPMIWPSVIAGFSVNSAQPSRSQGTFRGERRRFHSRCSSHSERIGTPP